MPVLKNHFSMLHSPPIVAVLVVVAVVLLINGAQCYYLLQVPYLDIAPNVDGSGAVTVKAADGTPVQVNAIATPGGAALPLTAADLIDEPDAVSSYAAYRQFFVKQSALYTLLQQPLLELHEVNGNRWTVAPRPARWLDLPPLFWLQLLVQDICLLAGFAVWLFRRRDTAAAHYGITGLCLALLIIPAAIYSSRELAINGETFRYLSALNHLGGYLSVAAITALLLCHPQPLYRGRNLWALYLLALLQWGLLHIVEVYATLDFGMRMPILLAIAFCFVVILIHHRRSARQPLYRQNITWVQLTIFLGCAVPALIATIPPLLGWPIPAEQGALFAMFLIVYLGLAVGISRVQLFNLDRWWFQVWLWVAMGAFVIGLDLLFVRLLGLSERHALWPALAVAGWLYFPLRQWLITRLLGFRSASLESHLPLLVHSVAGADTPSELETACRESLRQIYQPLTLTEQQVPTTTTRTRIGDNGQTMSVPLPLGQSAVTLAHRDEGRRLFSPADADTAAALVDLFRQAITSRRNKAEAIRQERERIKQDMHDTLGGRLLSIVHQRNEPESAAVARIAWRELRDILTALEGQTALLAQVIAQWQIDAQQQCDSAGVALHWTVDEAVRDAVLYLAGEQRLHLGQILRELLTNALRHATATTVEVRFSWQASQLTLSVQNDGVDTPPATWTAGRGLHHMRRRADTLNASIDWIADGAERGRGRVCGVLTLPLLGGGDEFDFSS